MQHGHSAAIHHLRAALAVGSLVTLLHTFGLLGWLDATMLRLVTVPQPMAGSTGVPPQDLPRVILIGSALYETAFQQVSPLHPAGVATLVEAIGAAEPANLVVDLDLSPGLVDEPKGRAALDHALSTLAANGTRVVLPNPQRVTTSDLQDVKFAWMRRLCGVRPADGKNRHGGIRFGLANVTTHGGVVTQYDQNLPSLGVVASRSDDGLSLCRLATEASDRWKPALVSTAFDNRGLMPARALPAMRPFSLRLMAHAETHIANATALDRLPFDLEALRGSTVVLGGAFDAQDRFITVMDDPERRTEGAVVHAVTFDSLQHPTGVIPLLGAFLLDIALGMGMGYLFAATWGWHTRLHGRAAGATGWVGQVAPRFSMLLNGLLVAALVALTVLIAYLVLYPANWWVNPGPIVLGVFAKFVLASRVAPAHDTGHPPDGPVAAQLKKIDTALLAVLVASALACILLLPH